MSRSSRPSLVVSLAVLATTALFVRPSAAQEPAAPEERPGRATLSAAVAATALELRLADGRLEGPGAEWLRRRAAESAAVIVGESHGVAEVPLVVGALLADLRPLGFRHLAIETGPVTGELVERLLRQGGEAYEELIGRHPFGVPFYGWRGEVDLLRATIAAGGEGPVLWGIDQEFVLSPPIHLATLRGLATVPAAVAAVDELLARPMPEGAPLQAHPLALTSLSADDVAGLVAAFADEPSPRARRLLDEIAASHEIYRLFMAGENYRSNEVRAALLRKNLLAHYRAAERVAGSAPRFVAKLGLSHVYRGRTPNNAFDVGNLALALADEQGRRSFSLAVVCGPGSTAAGFGGPGQPCAESLPSLGTPSDGGWLLYDLESVRAALHEGRLTVDDADLAAAVWNLDAALVLPGATAAEALIAADAE